MDTLVSYPYIVVRIACRRCKRKGAYRLVRLAEKFGADIEMEELLARLTADCYGRTPGLHPSRSGCLACFVDIEGPRTPPDLPPQGLRVITGGRRS